MKVDLPGAIVYRKAFLSGLKPDPIIGLADWSDQYRVLSTKASAEPGRFRTDRTPYLREIMDCLSSHSEVQEVAFMKGSQVGATELGTNWMGYIVDCCPAPTMVVQPTDGLAKRYSKQRLDDLFKNTPRVAGKIRETRDKDKKTANTALMKEYDGGFIAIVGAKSASQLRSMPIKLAFFDEEDNYDEDADGEGDPVELGKARMRTFARRKCFEVSTPTLEATSRIQRSFLAGDQRYYFVPCPECGYMQRLIFGQLKWPKGEPEGAYYECEHCGTHIQNHQKTEMLRKGKWIPTNTKHKNPKRRSYHISALYSPVGWMSWAEIAEMWMKAQKDPLRLMVFVNTVLGETWKEQGERPEWDAIYNRRETYPIGSVPDGVLFLVAGVDVQKDRIEYEVVGYGRDKQSWSIDYGEIEGDTSKEETFNQLEPMLSKQYLFESNPKAGLNIRYMAIDSGYNTQAVYNWARQHPQNVMAVKGVETQPALLNAGRSMDVTWKGKTYRRGVMLWRVGTNIAKTELYSWLKLKPPVEEEAYQSSFCHFPQYEPDYFKMLCAEQMRVRYVRTKPIYEWYKIHERNEALDCRVYARAAASRFGLDRFTIEEWDSLEKFVHGLKQKDKVESKQTNEQKKGGIPTRKSSFWGD